VRVENLGDHRICMATSCLSLVTGIKSYVNNFETVNTSFDKFLIIMKKIGANYEIKK